MNVRPSVCKPIMKDGHGEQNQPVTGRRQKMDEHKKVPRRIAQTVLNSLKGGVVPRIGLPYITVGRKSEIEALLHDVEIISDGGAAFRFVVDVTAAERAFCCRRFAIM